MAVTFEFDPERIAYFEAAGWRAYYDHKWLKMLRLLVGLCQEQFNIPFPMSLVAAYYTTRASLAWVPIDHDESKVLAYLEKFYRVARRYSGLTYDVSQVAALELQYFDVHRRLSGKPEKDEFLQTLVDLHSAIFGLPAERVWESAEWRLHAANTVDQITSKTSTDIEGDWTKLEEDLRRCYGSIQHELKIGIG
ncbi:MAG TPA: hypothetical protein VHV10_21630 [Ktedonobacteraceae bacterium]|jgi:hypothetical protein|nr:hypothetical protein [Ktedonobacteraceae bacterium]